MMRQEGFYTQISGRFWAYVFATFVVAWTFVAQGASISPGSCQNVFQSQPPRVHRQPPVVRGTHVGFEGVAALLRQIGFKEFKMGTEGALLLQRLAERGPEIIQFYVKELKIREATLRPDNSGQVVEALDFLLRLSQPFQKHCRGGNCRPGRMKSSVCTEGRCTNRLIEGRLITGDEQLLFQYKTEMTLFGHPLQIWVSEPVMVDNLTGALIPKGVGVRVLNNIIDNARTRAQPTALIFIDVNDLSKVNYFQDGFNDGNAYISAVGRILKNSLRQGDSFLRIGGDEFVLIVDGLSSDDVVSLSQRLISAVASDPNAWAVFQKQWAFIEGRIQELSRARSMNDLSEETRSLIYTHKEDLKMKAESRGRPVERFEDFKADALEVLRSWFEKQKVKLAPNVSIGSTFIRSDDSLEQALDRASCNANVCKREHKEALGADAEKYGGVSENEELLAQHARNGSRPLPRVLPPDYMEVQNPHEVVLATPRLIEDFYH